MKELKIVYYLLFFTISTIILGCKGDTGPIGPGGPSLSGTITGLVNLIDTNGVQPANRSGISVSIDGTTKSAVTDSTGKWTINALTTGIYAITISKANYGMTKHINLQFVGGGTTYIGEDVLSATPNFSVSNLSYTPGNQFVDVKGNLSYSSTQTIGRNVILFIGNSSNVSSDPATYLGVVNGFANDTATTFTQRITTATFNQLGIATGSATYIIAYSSSAPAANSSRYTDIITGRFIYTSLGSSPSAVLPIVTPMMP